MEPTFPFKYKQQSTIALSERFNSVTSKPLTGNHSCMLEKKGRVSCHLRYFLALKREKGNKSSNASRYQRDPWSDMVELKSGRGRMRVWKDWKRWRGLYKSRWKEIKERGKPVWSPSLSWRVGLLLNNRAIDCVSCLSVCWVWMLSEGCVCINERRLEAV